MNGNIRSRVSIPDDFEPLSELNQRGSQIAITYVGPDVEVITYSAAEARRYAAAFTRAAELLEQPGGAPVSAEQAEVVAARAMLADFQHVTHEFTVGSLAEPDWFSWALRLAQHMQQLLDAPPRPR